MAFLKDFIQNISKVWGEENVKVPQKTEYVKYLQNYKSRALIDFDKGIVTVETLDEQNPKESLKNAVATTLLLPDDPRSVDLFGTDEIKLGGTPYLLGEVKDDQNKDIRYQWRANRYADILIKNEFKQKRIRKEGKHLKLSYVQIPMVKDHANVRVAKFKTYVQKFAAKYNLSQNLVFAIIRTESNFNQFAISGAGAVGLMGNGDLSVLKGINIYALFVVAATICYGINVNEVKFKLASLTSIQITSLAFLFTGPLAGILLLFTDLGASFSTPGAMINLGYIALLALFSSVIAVLIFNQLIKFTTPIFASSVTYIIPLFAVMWGVLDGESFGIIHMVWIGIILLGVYLVNK